jgi:hypothetical protein
MLDPKADGRLQLTAALALLATSRLVLWAPDALAFCPVERDDFEARWRKEVHPVFGRLICWITFSAGAELLAKGVCLSSGIEVRDPHTVPTYPQGDWTSGRTRSSAISNRPAPYPCRISEPSASSSVASPPGTAGPPDHHHSRTSAECITRPRKCRNGCSRHTRC